MGKYIYDGDLEVKGKIICSDLDGLKNTPYTIDFSDNATYAEDWNINDKIKITKIYGNNVGSLECSAYTSKIDLSSGLWTGEINVNPNTVIKWTIERKTTDAHSSIGVVFETVKE